MILLHELTKYYPSSIGNQYIFDNITFEIPAGHNIAILGSNGAGKSTLFRLLAGSEYPNKGRVIYDCSISWPVALSTGIHPLMTGRENARFIGRINGVKDLDLYEERVQQFAELGNKFELPVRNYSSGMRPRLAFACVIAIDFDIYLIDEATSVGDHRFKLKAKNALIEKSQNANVIMVSHDTDELKQFCDSAIVLEKGKMTFFNDINEGIESYRAISS